ncbi:MAG: FHA domain-containing protein, partial [Planctomycetota bacterium]
MLELIAQGKTAQERWRKVLLQEIPFVLGRTSSGWAVTWDEKISRHHARLQLVKNELQVERVQLARNPIFFNGHEHDRFTVHPGEHFVIGDTTFLMTDDSAMATLELPSPIAQRSFSTEFLRHVQYEDADQRIEVLNRLPEVISSSHDANE